MVDPEDESRRNPQQPVPNQPANVEMKDRAKKTRKSRRSTQGVTIDTVNEAKKLFDQLDQKRQEEKETKNDTESKGASGDHNRKIQLKETYIEFE